MKFKGTIIAVIVILLLVILSKFGFNEDFSRNETLVEPTEDVTLGFLENTQFGSVPTEN